MGRFILHVFKAVTPTVLPLIMDVSSKSRSRLQSIDSEFTQRPCFYMDFSLEKLLIFAVFRTFYVIISPFLPLLNIHTVFELCGHGPLYDIMQHYSTYRPSIVAYCTLTNIKIVLNVLKTELYNIL